MIDLKEIDNKLYGLRWKRDSLPKENEIARGQLAETMLTILDQYTEEEFNKYQLARRNLGYSKTFSDL